MQEQIDNLQAQISQLKQDYSLAQFNNIDSYISIKNLQDFIEVVSVVPAQTPRNLYEQIKIYISGGTYRLYVYNYKDNAWRYATLT